MRKTRRFGVGGSTDEEAKKDVFKNYKAASSDSKPIRSSPSRERIITKEQVEAKGFTNLQDFLNDERKLKRKDGKPAERVTDSSVSGSDLSKYYADQKKPAEATAKPAAAAPKKEEKEEENTLAFGIPAVLATAAAAAFGANKMAKKEAAQRQVIEDLRNARSARDIASSKEAKNAPETAEARKIAKEGLDTKAKRGMSKTGGGGGGRSARSAQLGEDFDPKRLTKGIEYKRGGKIRRFAAGGEVAAKKAPEPPISKATQESMKRQAAQAKIDRKQAEEQKAGEREVRENMGRIGFKKGGSASRRADGCAIRGKTRA
jgi:hypothetical protein